MTTLLSLYAYLSNIFTMTVLTYGIEHRYINETVISVADTLCPDHPCSSIKWDNMSAVVMFNSANPTQQCCGSCWCSSQFCHMYGKFCEATERQLKDSLTSFPLAIQKQTCFNLHLESNKPYPLNKDAVYMTSSCLDTYHKSAETDPGMFFIIEMCEHAINSTSFISRLPVLDNRTGLTFYNMYCAICNGVPDTFLLRYEAQIICQASQYYMPSGDLNKIVSDLLDKDGCTLWYTKPDGVEIDLEFCDHNILNSCKVDVTVQCYTDSTEQIPTCYMAHNRSIRYGCYMNRNFRPPSLSLLITLADHSTQSSYIQNEPVSTQAWKPVCSADFFYDTYKRLCRPLSCTAPKSLVNGKCQSLVRTLSGVNIDIFLKLTPTVHLRANEFMSLEADGYEFLYNFMKDLGFGNATTVSFYGRWNFIRDLEARTMLVELEYIVCHLEMNVHLTHSIDAGFIDAFVGMSGQNASITPNGTLFYMELVDADIADRKLIYWPNTQQKEEVILWSIYLGITFSTFLDKPFIRILPTSTCTLITLDALEYDILENKWGIEIPELNATLMKWNYVLKRHERTDLISSVSMCAYRYETLIPLKDIPLLPEAIGLMTNVFNNNTTNNISEDSIHIKIESRTTSSMASVVLTLICTSLSITGALLTILTYSLFKVMRKQPGINNIALCSSLIAAQLFLLFGIGQKDYIPDWACKLIGLCVHFFWLLTIMWMNVCSYHTFRVFWTLNKANNNSSSRRTTCMYVLYTTITAAIPVFVNMMISVVTNNVKDIEKDFGYGKRVCYISNRTNVKLTFGLPIGIVTVVNIVLFVATVFKVRKMSNNMVVKIKDRKYSSVYVRLSSVTGCMWLFGIVYMFTHNAILEMIFIIFNASQGVLIFISFVCNKSCARLYLDMISRLRKPSVTPSTTATAYGASVTPMNM